MQKIEQWLQHGTRDSGQEAAHLILLWSMCKYTIFAPKWWYCNARDFGSQLVLFWLLGGCFDKSQQCQSSNHSWAQCYLSEVLLLTSWLLFLFVLFHCSLTIVHTSAISWGIAVALPMQKIPKHCGKIHPSQTHSDKKQAHSTQFKNVQSNQKTPPFEKHRKIQTKKSSVL